MEKNRIKCKQFFGDNLSGVIKTKSKNSTKKAKVEAPELDIRLTG